MVFKDMALVIIYDIRHINIAGAQL